MRWLVLNPPSSTAFLDKAGRRHWLLDMQGSKPCLAESLRAAGSAPERMACLFVTHQHPDHFTPSEALPLAEAGTEIYMGQGSWDALPQTLAKKPERASEVPFLEPLRASGRLHLLPPYGKMALDGREVAWATYAHGDGSSKSPNLAFRIDDHVFSGDLSLREFFNAKVPGSDELLDLTGGNKVKVLALNIAQISRHEIREILKLEPQRRENYLENHGVLEDLESYLGQPNLLGFFQNLSAVVPHHLRRAPLPETEALIATRLEALRDRKGFGFEVRFR